MREGLRGWGWAQTPEISTGVSKHHDRTQPGRALTWRQRRASQTERTFGGAMAMAMAMARGPKCTSEGHQRAIRNHRRCICKKDARGRSPGFSVQMSQMQSHGKALLRWWRTTRLVSESAAQLAPHRAPCCDLMSWTSNYLGAIAAERCSMSGGERQYH